MAALAQEDPAKSWTRFLGICSTSSMPPKAVQGKKCGRREGQQVIARSSYAMTWPRFASLDVIQVVLADTNASLVTITFDENVLASAVPLLRVPYFERLLEAVRSGIPLNGLVEPSGLLLDRLIILLLLTLLS